MLTTRYVDGAPNWTDLGTPDLDGAVDFYTGLFGWEYAAAWVRRPAATECSRWTGGRSAVP